MICVTLQNKTLPEILSLLDGLEMAEIRLDRCPLTPDEIEELFSTTDIPLVATCRVSEAGVEAAQARLLKAIESGATYVDVELEAPAAMGKRLFRAARDAGITLIRSFHDFGCTPPLQRLQELVAECRSYGADIAKIVTTARDGEDATRTLSLYGSASQYGSIAPEELIAFSMGPYGRQSRLDCLRLGAPYTYAALSEEEAAAPGQWAAGQMRLALYGDRKAWNPTHGSPLRIPSSKSFAQRAIIAAALADGASELEGYSPCGDNEAALQVAKTVGATIERNGDILRISGIAASPRCMGTESIHVGESGLLTRMMIPILACTGRGKVSVTGEKTLLGRPLKGASDLMASFGVILSDNKVPLTVQGNLIPGRAELSGKDGSQLISGLLMALPLADSDSQMLVTEPKSIPYMFITLDVLRKFGIRVSNEMEGDADFVETGDWNRCTGISFRIRGGQRYKAASFAIEGDWSTAAGFLVAAAIFGKVELTGLDSKSLQADLGIIDILAQAGACISYTETEEVAREMPYTEPLTESGNASAPKGRETSQANDAAARDNGTTAIGDDAAARDNRTAAIGDDAAAHGGTSGIVTCQKAPLRAFTTDLNNAPDLFPTVAVLAAFSQGESHIAGLGRLASKESDRGKAIVEMLAQMGVEAHTLGDEMVIRGKSLSQRLLRGELLKGGSYTSHHDHRMVMALSIAALGSDSPIEIDDTACVAKSCPGFLSMFGGMAPQTT